MKAAGVAPLELVAEGAAAAVLPEQARRENEPRTGLRAERTGGGRAGEVEGLPDALAAPSAAEVEP